MNDHRARMTDVMADIPTFVAVVEAGGFAAASRRLSVTRSAVGKSIARLEERLDTCLFHRTTRTQRLTDDGTAFYEHCLRALDELSAGRAQLESGRRAISGRLRVSLPVLFGRLCAAPILTRLSLDHPKLHLELHFSDQLVDLVDDRFDLVLRMRTPGTGSTLVSRRIALQETILCASPAYLETWGAPNELSDLSAHHAVTYAYRDRIQAWTFRNAAGERTDISPPSRLQFGDLASIANAATEGLGLAWLPTWLVGDRLSTGKLQRVMPQIPPWVSDVYLVWMQSLHLPSRMRAAIDTLVAGVPALMQLHARYDLTASDPAAAQPRLDGLRMAQTPVYEASRETSGP